MFYLNVTVMYFELSVLTYFYALKITLVEIRGRGTRYTGIQKMTLNLKSHYHYVHGKKKGTTNI